MIRVFFFAFLVSYVWLRETSRVLTAYYACHDVEWRRRQHTNSTQIQRSSNMFKDGREKELKISQTFYNEVTHYNSCSL